jgi:hypothetical protein
MQGFCRWKAAGGDWPSSAGPVGTTVPGVERAPSPAVSHAAKRDNPVGVPPLATGAGKPTVRQAQFASGQWMTKKRKLVAERQQETGTPCIDGQPSGRRDPA